MSSEKTDKKVAHTRKPPPRYVKLTPEREAAIDEFLKLVRGKYDPLPMWMERWLALKPADDPNPPTFFNPERLYAYMFLVSRDWDIKKAMEFSDSTILYRAKNHLDDANHLVSAFQVRGWDQEKLIERYGFLRREKGRIDRVCAGVDAHFSCGLHYWDRCGLPVLYMMLGSVNEAGLLKKLKQLASVGESAQDVMWEYVMHAIAVGEMLSWCQQKAYDGGELKEDGVDASEGHIRAVTIVVDVSGLNYKMLWKPALDLFQGVISAIFSKYPDCVYRILVVNCPSMIMFAYSIVKGMINEAVQRKVSFYNPEDTFAALSAHIDPRHIPAFLGGECHCDGNCIGSYDPANPTVRQGTGAESDDGAGDVVTEDITLKAGKTLYKEFDLCKNEKAFWEFVSNHGRDVNFTVYFVPTGSGFDQKKPLSPTEPDLKGFIVRRDRPSEGNDSFTAPDDGKLLLVWDNKHSWLKSKSLQMRVYKDGGVGTLSRRSSS